MSCVLTVLFLGVCVGWAFAIDSREYQSRRKAYSEQTKDGVTVLFNSLEDELREFLEDKNFYYLTGASIPEAVLVLSPSHDQHHETMFIPDRNLSQEKWTGVKPEPGTKTAELLGIERVLPLSQFQSELMNLSASRRIYTTLSHATNNRPVSVQDQLVSRLKDILPFYEFLDAAPAIAQLRMKKSESELKYIRRAIQITEDGHQAAASMIQPQRFEYEIEAALEYQFRRQGSARPAFPSIVGSGPNSVVLHYDKNSRRALVGEVVVVDIGAEFEEYAADVTRTYPVSGKFSERQKEIYNIVLEAQEAALKEVKPGAVIAKSGPIHKAAYDYINSHGKDSKGNALGQYFIHGTSHHLGLEVHDAVDTVSKPLEPGMVITVEPGIYLPDEDLGVRIEDDVLVTATGYELLSKNVPRTSDGIEQYMRQRLTPNP
jgi:Xaa-Pro aminopeptidase